MFIKTQKNGGFTLIETIIYVALFGLMIGGLFISLLQIYYNTNDLRGTVAVEEEINFTIRKMDSLMNDIRNLEGDDVPDGPDGGTSVSFVKSFDPSMAVEINLDGTRIEVCIDGNCGFITSANITVDNLIFKEIPPGIKSPRGIETDLVINGRAVGLKKYLRI